MRKDYEKLFGYLPPLEPPQGLFDRIILAIKKEQELRHTRRLLFGFLLLLILSIVATPLSFMTLTSQMEKSGTSYFISAALNDFGTFFSLWQEFSLAILESLPIMSIAVFALSLGIAVFTLRLFLYKKRLLFGYLVYNFS